MQSVVSLACACHGYPGSAIGAVLVGVPPFWLITAFLLGQARGGLRRRRLEAALRPPRARVIRD